MALPDTGTVAQLEVQHSGTDPWFLQSIMVLNQTTGAQASFRAERWVAWMAFISQSPSPLKISPAPPSPATPLPWP
jgi:hypothetical protein